MLGKCQIFFQLSPQVLGMSTGNKGVKNTLPQSCSTRYFKWNRMWWRKLNLVGQNMIFIHSHGVFTYLAKRKWIEIELFFGSISLILPNDKNCICKETAADTECASPFQLSRHYFPPRKKKKKKPSRDNAKPLHYNRNCSLYIIWSSSESKFTL